MQDRTPHTPIDSSPIDSFSQCHAGILSGIRALAGLPELIAAAERARRVATETLSMFDSAVLDHHADEETELFPAVLQSSAPGEERARVEAMIDRLVMEHRAIEDIWKRVKPGLRCAAAGKAADVNTADVAALMRLYAAHAGFEESHFLPLAQEILGRNDNHMAALGLSLHLRHAPQIVGYI
jgi:hypothetical protein